MVKFEIIIALVLMLNTAHAQIFKCETQQGKIIYQDIACKNSSQQRDIIVKQFDPKKTLQAQKKLRRELHQRMEIEAIKAEQALKKRHLLAIEAQARSNENLANAAYENANALDRNTETYKYRNLRSASYYYNPLGNNPANVYLHKQSAITSSDNGYATRGKTKAINFGIPRGKSNHLNHPHHQSSRTKTVSKHFIKQNRNILKYK